MAVDPYVRTVFLRTNPTRIAVYVLIFCAATEFAFVALDYYVNYRRLTTIGALRRMFNIEVEDGLASWFSITQTFFVALTLWLVFAVVRHQPGPAWRRWGWLILALFFSYMAVDDGAQLHERLGHIAYGMVARGVEYYPSYAWQVVFGPPFAALVMVMMVFLLYELDNRLDRVLVLAALAGWAVAVMLDFVEGLDQGHPWDLYTLIDLRYDLGELTLERFGKAPYETLRHFSKSVEEAVEMMAMTFFWFVFLRHLGRLTDEVHVRLVR